MKTDKRIEDREERCEYCGDVYDSYCEGHTHFEAGGCECKYCQASKALEGKNFCSQECECKYVNENNVPLD